MSEITNTQMIKRAMTVLRPRNLAYENRAGGVASALLSAEGNLYFGVCVEIGSGIGFCAEHSAIAAMITAGESRIAKIVAVSTDGKILPPCGRCREFMFQIDTANLHSTLVILGPSSVAKLEALLPHPYTEVWDAGLPGATPIG
jgi:cytidine deaminase